MSAVAQLAGPSALKIARGFTLPLDIVTRKTAILAKSGAGKSNAAKVIVEGVLDADAQVVIVDPVGHWWGLRSLYPIPVLGGMNGDIPLDPLAGKMIADVAAESGQSMILDVSLMDSDGEMQRFAYEFAERFYKQKQLHPTAVLVVLEEADEFAPQDTRGANVPRMVGAWARIAKRGRGRGIGLLSVTLRSAALSKNVLNQSDGIIAMRTTAPLDIKAVEEWVKATRAVGADDVIPSLPGLATGEAWFWIPEYGVLQRVKVNKARSLDTSATPEVGAKLPEAKKLKPIDLAALGERMQSTVERAKENDPDELRKRIRDLERAPRARPVGDPEDLPAWENYFREDGWLNPDDADFRELALQHIGPPPVEVVALTDDLVKVQAVARFFTEGQERVATAYEGMREILDPIAEKLDRLLAAKSTPAAGRAETTTAKRSLGVRKPGASSGDSAAAVAAPTPVPVPPSRPTSGDAPAISGSQQKILDALAWFEAIGVPNPRRVPTAAIAGVSAKSSGFRANVSTLSGLGLLRYPETGRLCLTDEGHAIARKPEAVPTREALQEAVYAMLSGPQALLLRILVQAGEGVPVTREDLAAAAGVSAASSGFRANVSTLSGWELVTYPSPGTVAADPILFP